MAFAEPFVLLCTAALAHIPRELPLFASQKPAAVLSDLSTHKMPTADIEEKRRAAREVIDILEEISLLLNTGLDRNTLSICVSLIENGVNPEALATVVQELRKESARAQQIGGAGPG